MQGTEEAEPYSTRDADSWYPKDGCYENEKKGYWKQDALSSFYSLLDLATIERVVVQLCKA